MAKRRSMHSKSMTRSGLRHSGRGTKIRTPMSGTTVKRRSR